MNTDNFTPISISNPQTAVTDKRNVVEVSIPFDEAYPNGTSFRLASIAMALGGARELANNIIAGDDKGSGVMGILDLAVAELTRISEEHDALKES
jgi:hypothetical protein